MIETCVSVCHTVNYVKNPLVEQLIVVIMNFSNVDQINEYEGLSEFEKALADICSGWIGREIGWKEYIKDNADVLLKIAFSYRS